MATALSPTLAAALQAWRTKPGVPVPGVPYTGTVSELQAGDFIHGSRTTIVAPGATSGSGVTQVRALTVERLGETGQVSWPPAQTVIFER